MSKGEFDSPTRPSTPEYRENWERIWGTTEKVSTMYEKYPNPPIGVTVWHKGLEEFGVVVSDTPDPTSVILDFHGEHKEVSRGLLEKSIFAEDNQVPR